MDDGSRDGGALFDETRLIPRRTADFSAVYDDLGSEVRLPKQDPR